MSMSLGYGFEDVDKFRRPESVNTIVSNLPSHIVEELIEAFKMFDLNGDGKISRLELGIVLHSLGESLTEADLERMINEVDADGDGEINLQEFIDLNTDCVDISRVMFNLNEGGDGGTSSSAQDALKSAFRVFDTDKNGYISAEELHKVLASLVDRNISIDDCRYMISCVDTDGDEMVDFREFQGLMTGSLLY